MKILVIGSGGREHAIVRKLKESKRAEKLYCSPGNGGIAADAQCVSLPNTGDIISFVKQEGIGLVFVAPDDPLVAGMVDELEAAGIKTFGPSKKAAEIEGSKVFSKDLMRRYSIPTAGYRVFDKAEEAVAYIREQNSFPVVIKADGLALGKGVIIPENMEDAQKAVYSIMEDKMFGSSGNQVVVEEFMTGPELTVLAFTDGKCLKPMVSSMDHKRALDGNKGLNTGGMGTISPNPHYSREMEKLCMDTIFMPTVEAMNKEGRPFKGCLYFGIMLTPKGPRVIEYNCRFGDPEAQVVLPRLKTDFLEIVEAVCDGRLEELEIEWSDEAAACVIMASGGYPTAYDKGYPISGLDESGQAAGCTVYHAGTAQKDGAFVTNGGRVLGITAKGADLEEALENAYKPVSGISFQKLHYRRDIGRT